MSVLDVIHARSSYRGRFASETVPREHLRLIMEAGLLAPSGNNKQTTYLVAVDDSDLLDRLNAVIEPPVWEPAPASICVLTKKMDSTKDESFATQDYAAAIENMLLAIVDLGYQSCWIEGYVTDDDQISHQMAGILHVPEEFKLVCILPIGKTIDAVKRAKKVPFKERAWFNSFGKE